MAIAAAHGTITDELTGRSRIQTDHGTLGFGDIVVLLLDLVLFIYTAFRSYDFLTTTVPDGFNMLALVGLWGLDIGMIAWSLVWMFGSTAKYQDWIAMTFFVVDMIGVFLTSLTDSLMYGSKTGAMTSTLSDIAVVAIPIVIVGNVVAGFIYHMTSPETKARRAVRKADAEHREKMSEIDAMERDLLYAESYLLAKQDTLDKAVLLADIKTTQDALEKATRAKLRDQIGVDAVSKGNGNSTADSSDDKLGILKAQLARMAGQIATLKSDKSEENIESEASASLPNSTPAESDTPQDELAYHPTHEFMPVSSSARNPAPPSSLIILSKTNRNVPTQFVSKVDCMLNNQTINLGDALTATRKANDLYSISRTGDPTVIAEVIESDFFMLRDGEPFNAPELLAEPAAVKSNGHKPESPS